jgi:beta-N-acetylhexosaminidase
MNLRSRRCRLRLVAVFGAALVVSGLTGGGTAVAATSSPQQATVGSQVQALLSSMSLEDKVGQLFFTYVYGDSATTENPTYTQQNQALYGVDNGAQLIAKYHLGGVIYFTWSGNLQNPAQIASLSDGLQQAAMAQQPAVALLISTDQEGGNVTRIGAPVAVSPGNMAIGATFSSTSALRAATVTGQQLRALGINEDDAPVVDVNTNPANTADGPRSFGDRAGMVSAMAGAAVSGYQSAGVAATAKHFPGLGSTTINTDNGVAVTDETRAQIMANDIPPFLAAIAAGTDVIMTAHIIAPALDPSGTPASMSKPIVTGLLRDQLGYSGVVVTDALSAAALEGIPPAQRAVDGIEAGDDLLLMPESLPDSVQAVLDAIQDGTISEQRIDESVTRILTLKDRLGLFTAPYPTNDAVGTPGQLATMAGIAQDSMTLVKNDHSVLPLAEGSGNHVLVTGWGASSTQTLAADIATHGVTTQRVYTGSSPSAATIAAAVAAAQQNDITVATTNNAWGDSGQQRLVKALLATGKPVVVVALGGPYDIAYFDEAPTFLAAYGYQPNSLTAIANTLFGANPTGRLPVTIPAAGNPSQPLYRWGTGLSYKH